jgi:predicted ArsR family transcriptional regulator
MKRKEFLSSACTLGMCSCAGFSFLPISTLTADSTGTQKKESDWRLEFIHKRFAKLIESLNTEVDQEVKKKIIEDMGRACAREYADLFKKYKDNPEGYLDEIKRRWAENTEYNKETKTIRIIGKKTESCGCPFVNGSLTPKNFCSCSNGYNKEVFETILGKTVDIKIEESILGGGQRCIHLIKVV